jgi:hypothetical protein
MPEKILKDLLLNAKLDTIDRLMGFTLDLSRLLGTAQSKIRLPGLLLIKDNIPKVSKTDFEMAIQEYVPCNKREDALKKFKTENFSDKVNIAEAYEFIRQYLDN